MKKLNFIILLALSLSLFACTSPNTAKTAPTPIPTVTASRDVIAQGRLEPIRYTDIALNASGLVSEVLLREGDMVSAGDIIALLKSSDTQTLESARAKALNELTSAYDAIKQAQYELDNFDIPSDFEDMTPPQAVDQMLTKLETARTAYEPYRFDFYDNRYGNLDLSNPLAYKYATKRVNGAALEAKKRLDDAWTNYRRAIQWMQLDSNLKSAQTKLDQVKRDYAVLQDTTNSETIAGTRAALANAEIRAPFSGTITKLSLKVGEFAAAGQAVVTIADLSSWVVKTTDLTEIDVVSVKEGQSATVKLDAIPNVELNGKVITIGKNYGEKQGDIVYEVTVLLSNSRPEMRWGMTAEVRLPK